MKRVVLVIASALCLTGFAQAQQQEQEKNVRVRVARPDVERKVREVRERVAAIPNLTQEQRDQMKTLRVEMMKETNTVRNQIAEKQAHLKTLQATDNADMKAINKTIDEIASLQAQQMKAQAGMKVKTRALLTEEQKVMYDARGGNRMIYNFNTNGGKFNFEGGNGANVRTFKMGDANIPSGEELNRLISEELSALEIPLDFNFDFDIED